MKQIEFLEASDDPVLNFAKEEFVKYCRMANPTLSFTNTHSRNNYPVIINVCPSHFSISDAALDDAYSICVSESSAVFEGSNSRSVLFAIYRYLRFTGFRFLRPGQNGEVVPCWNQISTSSSPIPHLSMNHTFSLQYRGVCIEGADSIENILDYIDWMPKLGYNTFFLQFFRPDAFLRRWYTRKLNTKSDGFEPSEKMYESWDQSIENELKNRGLLIQRCGHGWTAKVLGYEKTGWEQTTENGNGKTDWIAQINGKRELFHGVPIDTNLCYSNEEVLTAFADTVVTWCVSHKDVPFVHVWLADEPNNVCECEECKKSTLSDQYISLLNKIARGLRQRHAATKIIFLLYQELLYPPKNSRIEDPSRFVLMFAPISRTFEKSYKEDLLAHPNGLPMRPYVRNSFVLPSSLSENIASLRGWQKMFSGDSFVYDYPLGRAHYGDFGYMKISQVLCEDIKCLVPLLHVNGYLSCQELRAFLPTSLPEYSMGLMLEDPERDFMSISKEYFRSAFGDKGEIIRTYLEKLSSYSSIDYVAGRGNRINTDQMQRYEKMYTLIKSADLSGNGPFFNTLRYHRECLLLLLPALISLTKGNNEKAQKDFSVFRDFISKNEDIYQADLDVYRISEILMRWTGFQPGFRE